MSKEKEVRKETDFWGNEREVVYEDGNKIGEIKTEERGGFFGIGAETVKVEYDSDGNETSYTKNEERGGFLGLGAEEVQVRYDSSDSEIGHSTVEERGGFFGIGSRHERIEYDNDGNEISQTHTEKRGDLFGLGGDRRRVTRYSEAAAKPISSGRVPERHHVGGGAAASNTSQSSGTLQLLITIIGVIVVALWLFSGREKQGAGTSTQEVAAIAPSNFRLTPHTIESIPAGLMLMRSPMGRFSYAEASRQCETLNYLGYSNWRVPSLQDLRAFRNVPRELDMRRYELFGGPEICGSHRVATYLFVSEYEMQGQYRYNYVMHCSYGQIDTTIHDAAVVCIRDTP